MGVGGRGRMFVSENTTEAKILRQQFEYHRGQVVSSFAHCEYVIGMFLYAIQDSEQFDGEFAYPVVKRVKKFRNVFEDNEDLNSFQGDAFLLIECFEKVINDRNDFVHGLARLNVSTGEVTIRRIGALSGSSSREQCATYKLDDLEERVQTFAEICMAIISLIWNVDIQFKLGLSSNCSTETNV